MMIFKIVKNLVEVEQKHTRKILEKLMIIEKDKLYADLKYPSLHKYLIKELKYSEAEATLRVNVVRMMNQSKTVKNKIMSGSMSLVNASETHKVAKIIKDPKKIEALVIKASENSTREFKKIVDKQLGRQRQEVLVLKEYMINKFDRLRKKYGDLSSLELIEIMLEKELKAPNKLQRLRKTKSRSRFIPKSVKVKVYTGECKNCGVKHGLEYDHLKKFSHGGTNKAANIQILCKNCNSRKEIQARQTGFFA